MLNDIVFGSMCVTFLIIMWTMMFFAFDNEVLGGYFKKKLRKRFDVDSVQ